MFINYVSFAIATIIYLHGFFPLNVIDNTKNTKLPVSIKELQLNLSNLYEPKYEKVVIVVIDALRFDFVTKNNTPFIWNFINDKRGCLSKVRVETPTVTLPRIKSLINGNIPQFSDIFFNLVSNEKIEDSLLHKAVARNKSIVFYGDDTWLKLFPHLFKRHEGTTSFYVNDYTEVDNNVTRNVKVEMEKDDWDIMILHYLGLDHIGHIAGPYSPLIQPKLIEMDNIIKNIYNKIEKFNKKYLILITGDHGMKDSGGHGGSTYSEMHVPLVMLGSFNCKDSSISQIDITPTLSVLLGIEIPNLNSGLIVRDLMQDFTEEQILYVARYNLLNLMSKSSSTICKEFDDLTEEHYLIMKNRRFDRFNHLISNYEKCAREISDYLKNRSTSQNILVLIMSALSAVSSLFVHFNHKLSFLKKVNCLMAVSTFLQIVPPNTFSFSFMLIATQAALLLICLISFISNVKDYSFHFNSFTLLLLLTLIHPVSFISSSFIEEEHQIWYYYGTTIVLLSIICNFKKRKYSLKLSLLLLAFRFIRRINQTGDKWASLPDIKLFLLQDENSHLLIIFFVFSSAVLCLLCLNIADFGRKNRLLVVTIMILIILFRLLNNNVTIARLTWSLIILNLILKLNYKNMIITWLLLSALLLRPYNVILLPFAIYSSNVINTYVSCVQSRQILYLFLSKILYFCQGHSNSLSSIDIAVGYIGLNRYNPFFVTVQVSTHSHIFPVLAYMFSKGSGYKEKIQNLSVNYFVLHQILATSFIMLVALLHRHHLFVWSVFAPKLLIESTHTIILLLIITIEFIIVKMNTKYL